MSSRAICPHCWPNAPSFEADTAQDAAQAVYAHIVEHHPTERPHAHNRATASHEPIRTYQATITGGLRVIGPSRYRMRQPRPTKKGNQYGRRR